jgi:hypothetical protein
MLELLLASTLLLIVGLIVLIKPVARFSKYTTSGTKPQIRETVIEKKAITIRSIANASCAATVGGGAGRF